MTDKPIKVIGKIEPPKANAGIEATDISYTNDKAFGVSLASINSAKEGKSNEVYSFEFIRELIAKADSIHIENYPGPTYLQNNKQLYTLYLSRQRENGKAQQVVLEQNQIPAQHARQIIELAKERNIQAFLED